MRYIILFVLTFSLFSCQSQNDNKSNDQQNGSTKDTTAFVEPTTRVEVIPLKQFPSGFQLDSVIRTDTSVSHNITLYFPASVTDLKWNKKVKSFLDKFVKDYYPEKGLYKESEQKYQSSVFDMWVTSFETSDKEIKCTFKMQSYYSGAAHYNQDSATFIYKK